VQFHCNDIALKIRANVNADVHLFHAFHLKFIFDANVVYVPVEATFSIIHNVL